MKFLSTLALVLLTSSVMASTTIKGLDYVSTSASEGRLIVKLDGNLKENPMISVKERLIFLTIPDASVYPKIEKKASVQDQFDTQILANQSANGQVLVKANLPFSLKGKESQVNIMLKDNAVEILFPKTAKAVTATKTVPVKKNSNIENVAEHLDESYLAKIEAEASQQMAKNEAPKKVESAPVIQTATEVKTDGVSLTQAASEKTPVNGSNEGNEAKSQFSVMGYIGKFVAFLSMLLLGFYGVLQLFKKGIIKKGNLGFLNSTKLVEVLSTTHVAPKRSLMMVRAHKQVFLVASSETGIQYLSEIKDVAGLLKEGEKAIAGSNFDSEFTVAEKIEKEFRMKDEVSSEDLSRYGSLDDLLDETDEPIKLSGKAPAKVATQAYGATKPNMGANKQSAEASKALARSIDSDKDQVRLSDQIKTKLRGLKQLQ